MHVELREGEVDTLLGEGLVDALVHIADNTPIVRIVAPHSHRKIDRTLGQLLDDNCRSGVGVDALVGLDQSHNCIACNIDIIAVSD